MGLFFNHRPSKLNTARGHRCPKCGSTDVEQQDEGFAPLPASPLTTFDGTHVAPVSEFRCRSCGYIWEDIFWHTIAATREWHTLTFTISFSLCMRP